MNARTTIPSYRLVQLSGVSASCGDIDARHVETLRGLAEAGSDGAQWLDGAADHGAGGPGEAGCVVHGANRRGQRVGHALLPDGSTHGFLWTRESGLVDLNVLAGNLPAGLVLVCGRRVGEDGAILAQAQGGAHYLVLEGRGRDEAPVLAPMVVTGILDTGQMLSFRANFTDVDRYQSHRATWEWGDGAVERGSVVQGRGAGSAGGWHSYGKAGRYTVVLTVRDSGGRRTVIRRTIAVGVPAVLLPEDVLLPWDTGEGGLPGLYPPR